MTEHTKECLEAVEKYDEAWRIYKEAWEKYIEAGKTLIARGKPYTDSQVENTANRRTGGIDDVNPAPLGVLSGSEKKNLYYDNEGRDIVEKTEQVVLRKIQEMLDKSERYDNLIDEGKKCREQGEKEMRKSELIQQVIEIEMEKNENWTISMPYIQYLKIQKRLLELGDVELLNAKSTESVPPKRTPILSPKNTLSEPKTWKVKTFMEEEIFEMIDAWSKEYDVELRKENLEYYEGVSDSALNKLKDKFRTPQGFRRAIEKAGLIGADFSKNTKNEVNSLETTDIRQRESLSELGENPNVNIHQQNKDLLDKDYDEEHEDWAERMREPLEDRGGK